VPSAKRSKVCALGSTGCVNYDIVVGVRCDSASTEVRRGASNGMQRVRGTPAPPPPTHTYPRALFADTRTMYVKPDLRVESCWSVSVLRYPIT
jgi:hypothetical protein